VDDEYNLGWNQNPEPSIKTNNTYANRVGGGIEPPPPHHRHAGPQSAVKNTYPTPIPRKGLDGKTRAMPWTAKDVFNEAERGGLFTCLFSGPSLRVGRTLMPFPAPIAPRPIPSPHRGNFSRVHGVQVNPA